MEQENTQQELDEHQQQQHIVDQLTSENKLEKSEGTLGDQESSNQHVSVEKVHEKDEAEDGDVKVDIGQDDNSKTDKSVSVGTSTVVVETQEVVSSSTSSGEQAKQFASSKIRSSVGTRRASYQSSRSYAGSFQNYGLTYLPYKSNFEPSEDARRRADEFLKTLRL